MKQLDARGLSCPQPVILVRKGMASLNDGQLEMLVDSITSRDNVLRAIKHNGCRAEVQEQGDEFRIIISK